MKDNNDDQNIQVKLVDQTQQTPRNKPDRLVLD